MAKKKAAPAKSTPAASGEKKRRGRPPRNTVPSKPAVVEEVELTQPPVVQEVQISGNVRPIRDDSWSEEFIASIKNTAAYFTAMIWESGQNPPLEETPYYLGLMETLGSQGNVWGGILTTRDDVIRQCVKFRAMFDAYPHWSGDEQDKIISRVVDGELMHYGYFPAKVCNQGSVVLFDARHRSAIMLAKNAPLEVVICGRDPKWQELVDKVKTLYPNALYQGIPHPDFYTYPVSRGDQKEDALTGLLVTENIKSIYDLGSCHGYTLYKLRGLYDWAIGVEDHPVRAQISQMVLDRHGIGFSKQDIMTFMMEDAKYYVDAIFALASLHHVARSTELGEFRALLRKIAEMARVFVVELPNPDEEQFGWLHEEVRNDPMTFISSETGMKITMSIPIGPRTMHVLKRGV